MSDEFELLHSLRINGRVPVARLTVDQSALDVAAQVGSIKVTDRGAMLTGTGLRRHLALLHAQVADVGREPVELAYDRFLQVNRAVKDVCARWQAAGPAPSDDALLRTVDALDSAFGRVDRPLATVGADYPRYLGYRDRLADALARADAGDQSAIADPGPESFHSVWFACHEDFLVTLGRDRDEDEAHE